MAMVFCVQPSVLAPSHTARPDAETAAVLTLVCMELKRFMGKATPSPPPHYTPQTPLDKELSQVF